MPAERQIDPTKGPVAEFAWQLRRVKKKAGITYRAMSDETHFSHAHFVRAAGGDKLPSWPVTSAFLRACGVTGEKALEAWEQFWVATDAVATRPTKKRRGRRGPDSIQTVAEFGTYLQDMSYRDGRRTVRELEALTLIGRSSINGWFKGHRLPSLALLRRFAVALGVSRKELEELQSARLRLTHGSTRGSALAHAMAHVLRTEEEDGELNRAARQVSAALVKAESHRVGRSMVLHAKEQAPDVVVAIEDPELYLYQCKESRVTADVDRRASRLAYELARFDAHREVTVWTEAQLALDAEGQAPGATTAEGEDPRAGRLHQELQASFEKTILERISELVQDTATMREHWRLRSPAEMERAVRDAEPQLVTGPDDLIEQGE